MARTDTMSEANSVILTQPIAIGEADRVSGAWTKRRSGLLFVLSGPSGVGKDAVINSLKEQKTPIHFAVTVTTRPRRPGEMEGINYYFVTVEQFHQMREHGELLEWAEIYGHFYGTPLQQVRETLNSSKDVLLKIDVQGAAKVKKHVPQAVFIFLAPETMDDLVERLKQRATEMAGELEARIKTAYEEIKHLRYYDYVVVNHKQRLEQAVEEIKSIITAEKCRVRPRQIKL
ncbi:MAG: guanylate kinase [Chloroflexi bacterium]|nr:guanylate kinase [Chloroflexota bacterium]MCL5075005.1 guanylate kinase [Chloroflexota bacterium]